MSAIDVKALEAAAEAAAAIRMIGTAGRLNDPDVSEAFRQRIRAETRAAITAYLTATSSAADARIARLEEALRPFASQTRVSSLTEEKMILRARAALGSDAE